MEPSLKAAVAGRLLSAAAAVGSGAFGCWYLGPRFVDQIHSAAPSLGTLFAVGSLMLMTCIATLWYTVWAVSGRVRRKGDRLV